jgi:hypothetical protein
MKKLLILLTLILYGCTDDTCICTETVTNVKSTPLSSIPPHIWIPTRMGLCVYYLLYYMGVRTGYHITRDCIFVYSPNIL